MGSAIFELVDGRTEIDATINSQKKKSTSSLKSKSALPLIRAGSPKSAPTSKAFLRKPPPASCASIKLASARTSKNLVQAVDDAQEAGRKYINVASRILSGENS